MKIQEHTAHSLISIDDMHNFCRSIFNYFLLSMAISDLISALISPLTVYHQTWGFNHWNFPALLCKVSGIGKRIGVRSSCGTCSFLFSFYLPHFFLKSDLSTSTIAFVRGDSASSTEKAFGLTFHRAVLLDVGPWKLDINA